MLSFRAINPITTPNHNVKSLITIPKTTANEISIPVKDKRLPKLPSVMPIPAGNMEAAPKIIDVE